MSRLQILALKCRLMGVAHEIRQLRRHALRVTGADRHRLRSFARADRAVEARALQILYGYLRGRSIEQIEAPNTRSPAPVHLTLRLLEAGPALGGILPVEADLFQERQALQQRIGAELRAWNEQVQKRALEAAAAKQA